MQQGEPAAERRTQQQRREETRSKLIEAAIDLIRKNGAASLTTMGVAKAAGLTRGAIQYHFEDPKDLLREVIVEVVHFLSGLVVDADLLKYEKEERISCLIDLYWKGYKSDTYQIFIDIAVQGRRDPALKQSIEEALSVLEEERNDQWLGLFHDFDQEAEEILSWRATLLGLLRGLALKQMFASTSDDMEAQFNACKEMFRLYIQSRTK